MNEITIQPGSIIIDFEFVEMLQETARLLVSTSAMLSSGATHIERNCPYSNDPTVMEAIRKMRLVSGDLAIRWESFDQALVDYEIAS